MKLRTVDLTLCALFAAVLAVCAWIRIPFGPIPFTLQTFGFVKVNCNFIVIFAIQPGTMKFFYFKT
mgnify:CR=1 FL=1